MPTIYSLNEIQSLADRSYSCGLSKMLGDNAGYLHSAASGVRALLGKIGTAASKAGDTAKLLAKMRVEVED